MPRALILSPFATVPLNAGHRRRVFRMTELLHRRGWRITLLVHAFEPGWRNGFDDDLYRQMLAQWDEVIVFHAGPQVGRPPYDGSRHGLDEWWNPDLAPLLKNLLSHRLFDVFVVHQLWQSKAFEAAPPRTIRVLETHGLFWPPEEDNRPPEAAGAFFMPSREDELRGIERADLAVVPLEAEAGQLAGRSRKLAVALPFFDAELARSAGPAPRSDYLSRERVSFGFLCSPAAADGGAIQAVLTALEAELAHTPAPVEVVIGGTGQERLQTGLKLVLAGDVSSEAALYKLCDFVVVLGFDGFASGGPEAGGKVFRVKVADCLALGVPVLAAAPASAGIAIPPGQLAETPAQLAALMVSVSQARPELPAVQAALAEAKTGLRQLATLGAHKLVNALKLLRFVAVLDLRAFDPATGMLPLTGYLSLLREIAWRLPVIVILADDLAAAVASLLPVGASAMAASAATAEALAPLRKKVLDASASGRERLGVRGGDHYVADSRWLGEAGEGAEVPLLHPDIGWDPAVAEIRRRWRQLTGGATLPADVSAEGTIVFVDHVAATVPGRVVSLTGVVRLLNIRRPGDFEAAVLMLLQAGEGGVAVVWAAADFGVRQRLVLEICALRRLVYYGGTAEGVILAGVPRLGEGAAGRRVARALAQVFATAA